jgi:AAHS family 4-hydroxybenzoate transporter-like MFS transporter
MTFSEIFTILAIPGLIAAAALMIKQFAHPEEKVSGSAVRQESLGH